MAILQKEALEYQRALFELPRFLFAGITIFSTAASFLVKDKLSSTSPFPVSGYAFVIGMLITFLSFIFAYSVVSYTVMAMKTANTNDEAEVEFDKIINGVYQRFSYFGFICVVSWLLFIVYIVAS